MVGPLGMVGVGDGWGKVRRGWLGKVRRGWLGKVRGWIGKVRR